MAFELDIHKYSDTEIKTLFSEAGKNIQINLFEEFYEDNIKKCRNKLQQILIRDIPNRKTDIIEFLNRASNRLISLSTANMFDQQAFLTMQPYPQKNTGFSDDGVFMKQTAKDNLNPNLEKTTQQIINIDSQYRESILPFDISNATITTSSTDFMVNFSQPLKDILSFRLYSLQVPYTWYTFDENLGNNFFYVETGGSSYRIDISSGNYSPSELESELNGQMTNLNGTDDTNDLTISFNSINGKFSITPTTTDASMTFFDLDDSNFTQAPTKYSQAPKLNYNLGWSLGFRPDYETTGSNTISYNSVSAGSTITAESIADTYGTKYLYVLIDDYNQNHMNKGLISIDVEKPFIKPTNYVTDLSINCVYDNDECDVSGGFGTRTKANGFNKVTKNQVYSQYEILKYRKTFSDKNSRVYAATTSNVFAVIPLDKNSLQTGSIITESGGPLKEHVRNYFGPVNIEKMRLRIVDDRGQTINLHGGEWVINLVAESLYKY